MMARLSTFILAVLAVVACGGEGSTEPPVPTPQTAVVTVKANDLLVFAGRPVALRDLVWRVTDTKGRPVTDYTLGAQLPSGWVLRNDSIIPPATEKVGRIRLTATYMAIGANLSVAPAAPSFDEAPLDTTDTATVTSAIDLKARQWKVSFACADTNHGGGMGGPDGLTPIDSIQVVNATVDSIVYASDSGWVPNFGGVAQVWYSGQQTRFLRDGTTEEVPLLYFQAIERQAPDSLVTERTPDGKQRALLRQATAPGQLLRYAGGTFCPNSWRTRRGETTLEEVAAP